MRYAEPGVKSSLHACIIIYSIIYNSFVYEGYYTNMLRKNISQLEVQHTLTSTVAQTSVSASRRKRPVFLDLRLNLAIPPETSWTVTCHADAALWSMFVQECSTGILELIDNPVVGPSESSLDLRDRKEAGPGYSE